MAFDSEMRSLEHRIAHGSGSRSSFIIAALNELPPGVIEIRADRCTFTPHAATAQPTRAKTTRVAHLQRRARFALVLAGDDSVVARAQPVADADYVYIPADFNPPR
jgi:hypothetical protein